MVPLKLRSALPLGSLVVPRVDLDESEVRIDVVDRPPSPPRIEERFGRFAGVCTIGTRRGPVFAEEDVDVSSPSWVVVINGGG